MNDYWVHTFFSTQDWRINLQKNGERSNTPRLMHLCITYSLFGKKNLSYIIQISYSRLEKVFSYCIITAELLVTDSISEPTQKKRDCDIHNVLNNCPIDTRSTFFWTEFTVKKYNTCLVPTESSIEKLYNNNSIKERFFQNYMISVFS